MRINLTKNMCFATVALIVALFVGPKTIQAQTAYGFQIGDTKVTSDNFNNLTSITGVSGNVKYDPESKTLTLENATIETNEEIPLITNLPGMTIQLIGNNTLKSKQRMGMMNQLDGDITFIGDGKLTIKGGTDTDDLESLMGIGNWGHITISQCTMEVEAEVAGLYGGFWKFDRCNLKAKGNGLEGDDYYGSICWLWDEYPEFQGCKITEPQNSTWKKHKEKGYSYFSLYGDNQKPVTDWVTITPENTQGIETTLETNTKTAQQGVFSLDGRRLSNNINLLPKGIYIVNGKKIVKK
ncbi:MAG: 50S ribosomal protein L7/L12 [Prevotella pallens]|nr:hypothetical protein [Prevotella pallens]MBF1525803.1 50S ribosomal protein L7/L12 [Prevotella pallens]